MATQPKFLDQFNHLCDEYLVKKAPAIPANIKEGIVKYGPYVILVLMLMAIPGILFAFGLGAAVSPFAYLGGLRAGFNFSVSLIFSLTSLVLQAIALPGLFKRSISGWNFVYYATLIGAVANLVNFNLGGLIVGTLLSLYLLFQIKSYYK